MYVCMCLYFYLSLHKYYQKAQWYITNPHKFLVKLIVYSLFILDDMKSLSNSIHFTLCDY